jgi:cytochrome c peroxidase
MGKAIAAYEKSLQHEPSRLDRYVDAVVTGRPAGQAMLQPDEVSGLRLFIGKAQCVTCHNGPLLTDQQFHNTGAAARAARPDRGRAAAAAQVRGEFNYQGPFSDARPTQWLRFMVSDDAALEARSRRRACAAWLATALHARRAARHAGQVVHHYVAAPHAVVGHSN